jgi:hypothetical protein
MGKINYNADNLRRAATAVRNLIEQNPMRSGWAEWVPLELDRQATEIEASEPARVNGAVTDDA